MIDPTDSKYEQAVLIAAYNAANDENVNHILHTTNFTATSTWPVDAEANVQVTVSVRKLC